MDRWDWRAIHTVRRTKISLIDIYTYTHTQSDTDTHNHNIRIDDDDDDVYYYIINIDICTTIQSVCNDVETTPSLLSALLSKSLFVVM